MNQTTNVGTGLDPTPRPESPRGNVDLALVRAVADHLPQLVWSCRPDGYCDYLSRRWVEYTGVPEAEHHGRGWLEAVYPADREHTRAAWDAFVAQSGEYDVDYRLRRYDGAYRWFKTRGTLQRDCDGAPMRVFGTTTDIDAQKRAEERLREAEERAAFVRRATGVGFWYCNLPFDVLEWDELVKAHFHLSSDARVTIQTFYDRIHPDDREPTRRAIEKSISERTGYDVQYRTTHPDTGAERWVRAIGRTFYSADGSPTRFDGVTLDVTDRKRVEDALRESERQFREMADTAPVALWLTDPEGACVFLSREWYEFTGQTEAEALGLGWTTATHPDDQEAAGRAFLAANAVRADFRTEYRLRTRTGSYRWAIDAGRPRFSPGGDYLGMVGAVFDIEDRKQAENALREADRKKDDFLALLAHELRNPLAPLRNGLQVIRLAAGNAETVAKARDMMDRQLGHMVRLIDDLLDVSRISRNKMRLRREQVLLADAVSNAVETARPGLDAADHVLTVSLPPEPLYLDADLTRLAQVFSNLLTNAAKYTPPGGRVWLTAEAGPSEVVVAVRDTGIGVPAEALPTIFDMFSQVDRSIEQSTGGLGIGLALVKGLVEMHGGRVLAESGGPGTGSTFTVTLPLASPIQGPDSGADLAGSAPAPARRVLVVDDNRDSAASMASMLELLGHEVRTAHDGLEAVVAAEDFRPNVVLMDVGMPRLNGYDATRRIRERPWGKAVTIIALTGWGQDGDRSESRSAGCDGHLVKPVHLHDLVQYLA